MIKILGEPKKIESFSTVKNNTYDTNHAVETIEPKWENVLKRIQQKANKKDENGITIITNRE